MCDLYDISTRVKHVVALCAAPGSWSWCGDLPLTVAIGVHLMDLIDGVNQVQGDITNVRTAEVLKCFHFHRKISRGSKEFLSALLMGDHNSEDNGRLDR
ncbi:hypothetical protein MUK42_32771 [Musa troglodytarum]|uniref:Uncharacterized protein n=1 Tax=Musa troglodytarum TaxID=320322 RepID=A0A9E7LAQ4_9LILI|nr:hypothetical protein MUK42_32771 [Musa troglodytarum]